MKAASPILAFFVLFLSFWGCQPVALPPADFETRLPLRLNGVEFHAQLALTPEEQAQGLMHRVQLGKNEGMLFVFPDDARRGFWMKNTHIPLDLGYFTADGILREIHPLVPYELTPVESSRSDIRFALEMNRGWFAQNHIEPGAQLDLELLRQAIERRSASTRTLYR